MKKCFLITSYCDTDEKVNTIRNTIDRIKKYDMDICVHAHYPLPVDVQNSVNYYIYDKSNPVFTFEKDNRGVVFWIIHNKSKSKIFTIKNDYGYTVVQQYKRSCNFLHSLDKYDIVNVINYDTKFTEEFFLNNNEYISNSDVVLYYYGGGRNYHLNPLFYSFKIDTLMDIVSNVSIEDYKKIPSSWVSEDYFNSKIDENKYNIKKVKFEDYGDIVDKEETTQLWSEVRFDRVPFKYGNFSLMGGSKKIRINDEDVDINLFELFFFDIENPLKINFKIGDDVYNVSNVRSEFYTLETSYTLDEFRQLLDENRVELTINDIVINKKEMEIFRTGNMIHNFFQN